MMPIFSFDKMLYVEILDTEVIDSTKPIICVLRSRMVMDPQCRLFEHVK